MVEETNHARELIQREIDRVLDSQEFAGSHRLSDFLRYVCQAALDGREEVDQTEIAQSVLGKDENFDPLEDAYVRKLATTVRQRLDSYYSHQGKTDPVVITLPRRSYLPRFRVENPAEPRAPETAHVERDAAPRRLWAVVAGAVVLLVLLGFYAWSRARTDDYAPGRFVVLARKGGIVLDRKDAPPESILLGPQVGNSDQVTARIVFSPQSEYDQAGIMIFDDVDNYVVLGRYLRQRTNLHFAAEIRRSHSQAPETFVEDPDGQTGEPVWLMIRRHGDEFRAFKSVDGHSWTGIGPVVRAHLEPGKSRLAIFAFSDFAKDSPVRAVFDHLSVGPQLATAGEDAPFSTALEGWHLVNECQAEATAVSKKDVLEISFAEGQNRCRWNLLREMPAGDWSMTGVVESATWARTFAGMMAIGSKDRAYVIRNNVGRGSIVGSTLTGSLFQRPDFPGNPPLAVRLQSKGGILRAGVGTNRESFEPLPLKVDLRELGDHIRAGFASGRGAYQNDTATTPVELRFLGMDVLTLVKYR
jgi:regulation of enolase protein 1 (concanavalin A-like superfamily)